MAPATSRELARKLRIMARNTRNEAARAVLLQSADRLEKPGHKRTKKRATVLYSVWRNKTDELVAFELSENECLERMKVGHAAFMKILRVGSNKWRIEKRFADEPEE